MVDDEDEPFRPYFGVTEYVVFVFMLGISASIGIYHRMTGGKQKTVNEYLLADRNMGALPVAFSLVVSFMSAVTVLGGASEIYTYGTQFALLSASYILGTPLVAFVYLPVFFRMQATSAYEYLEKRFGRATRLTASIIFQLQMVLYMGIVLYAPALALSAVTGFSKWGSVISLGVVCTFYSTIGGMKAVLWTDVFQAGLVFAAILIVFIKGFLDADSIADVFAVADRGGRLEFFNVNPDPTVRHTFWTMIIGGLFTYTTIYGVNQTQVQRLLTVKNLRKSQTALFISWPVVTLLNVMTAVCGLLVYYHYRHCDPLTSRRISNRDQLLPLYVMDFLSKYPGISGLFVSGLFSATLSTVSSAVNSLAAVTLEDYLKPCLKVQWTDKKQAFVSKLLVLIYGLICLLLTYVAEQLGGVLQATYIVFGVVGGPLLGVFSLGMFSTKTNQKGAIVGLVCSLALVCWMGFGASAHKVTFPRLQVSVTGCNLTAANDDDVNVVVSHSVLTLSNVTHLPVINDGIMYLYRVSYMWLAPIGFFVVFLLGCVVSILTGGPDKPVDKNLISPPFQFLLGLKDREQKVVIESEKVHPLVVPDFESDGRFLPHRSLLCSTKS